MNQAHILIKTQNFVHEKLAEESSGHDWWHIHRVHQLAKQIAEKEGGNLFIIELAALLHDISDWKFNGGDEHLGGTIAHQWLQDLGTDKKTCQQVETIINTLSFKGANVAEKMQSLEGKIVQDADRLDAIGAIGIARTFTYGGYKNRPMYQPNIPPTLHDSFDAYKNKNSHTINHFYEKILLLKDRMNTDTAKALAEERHQFVEQFLAQFLKEWELHQLQDEPEYLYGFLVE